MRTAALAVAICLLVAGNARAQTTQPADGQVEGLSLSDRSLVKETFRAGTTSLEVFAGPGVDVRALLKAAQVGKDETAQTIHDKVDSVRQRLYPKEPLVLAITAPAPKEGTTTGAYLVKGYYGWNYAGSWWAIWASTTAVLFVDDIRGAYNVYECYPCGSWRPRGTFRTGAAVTRYNFGGNVYRGFSLARGSGSQLDFVMYFFR